MRDAFRSTFGKWFSSRARLPAQISDTVAGWELERKLSRFRWIIVFLCGCSLPLWDFTDRSLLAGMCLVLGLGNWKLLVSLRQLSDADRLRCCRRLATSIDWVGGLALIAALDPLTPLSFFGPLIALVLVTQLRFGRIGLRLAIVGAATIVIGRTALDELTHESLVMLPAERLAITFITLAGLYYLLDVLRLDTQLITAIENTAPVLTVEGPTNPPLKLTRRYRDLLPLLARTELTYQDIARELCIQPETVKSHVKRLSRDLDLKPGGRIAIVVFAQTHGLLNGSSTPLPATIESVTEKPATRNAPEMHPKFERNAPD